MDKVDRAAGGPRARLRERGGFLLLSLLVVVLDQWSKWMIEAHLPKYTVEPVIPGFLNLTHVENTGVAFGLFSGLGEGAGVWLLVILGFLALGLVLLYFWHVPADNRLLLSSLTLILGGAVGNLMDRLLAGAVTDFIDVYVGTYHWHTFNVADTAISIGIGLIILDSLRPRPKEEPAEATPE